MRSSSGAVGQTTVWAPHRVRLPVNDHRWDDIAMLHWPVERRVVEQRLPAGLEPLTFDGSAWVSVTPFRMEVRRIAGVPVRRRFPETNVRTYVAGPDGRQGVWFLHMEVPARWFVVTLRSLGLPYTRHRMSIRTSATGVRYRSEPSHRNAGGHDVAIRPRERLLPAYGDERDRFLTARWNAFHSIRSTLLYTPVEHPSWELWSAGVDRADVGALFWSASLAEPDGPPAVVHWSPGVTVRVGPPRVTRPSRRCRRGLG